MMIVSWNLNSINARLLRLLSFLDRRQPDFLCLQELKCEEHQFPIEDLQSHGYHSHVFGQKAYNGVAILVNKQRHGEGLGTLVAKESFGETPEARVIHVRFSSFDLLSVYVPNGRSVDSPFYEKKLAWLDSLYQYLQAITRPVIVGGDLNIAHQGIDVVDAEAQEGHLLYTSKERLALDRLISLGLVDTARKLNPKAQMFTWWDYRMLAFAKNRGMRIDYLLVSKSLESVLRTASVDRDERKGKKPSDHAPVILEIDC
jgi:exodeoxyribonuclease III